MFSLKGLFIIVNFTKQIACIALGASLLGAGMAEASVSQDALVVGGIEYGSSESYVRSVYGAPREVETKYDPFYSSGQAVEWEYGNEFDIIFVNGVVRRVKIGACNGIRTKADISVGTDVNALIASYGQPDVLHDDKYIYFVDDNQTIGFIFEIENNRVDEINMGIIR